MAEATAREQFILELINRARMDPAGEAARYGIDLNKDLAEGTISATPKQVLAFDPLLNDSADAHSAWMLSTDTFSHTGTGSSSPGDRMEDAGYVFSGSWSWGENIAWSGTIGTLDPNAAAAQHHQNLFLSAGHRLNILNGYFREIGVGSIEGEFTTPTKTYNALMTTQNFATTGSQFFVTGVAYNDTDGNAFYSIGEGEGGIRAEIIRGGNSAASMNSWTAGGYSLAYASTAAQPVTVEVRFSGGSLSGAMGVQVTLAGANVKVDLVDGDTIFANVNARLTQDSVGLQLLGIEDLRGTGNSLANDIAGNSGKNLLSGGAGSDVLTGNAGNDVLKGGGGADTLNGGLGKDRHLGGAGGDTFQFRSVTQATGDVIADFEAGIDKIDLSAIDAVAGGGDNAFKFDREAFSGTGSLRVVTSGDSTLVEGDLDGNGSADFTITLTGIIPLTAADFIL